MSSRVARNFAIAEAIILLLPITLICLYGFSLLLTVGQRTTTGSTALWLAPPLAGLVALACGWVLILKFIRHGREELMYQPLLLWAFPAAMGIASIVGLWSIWSDSPATLIFRPRFAVLGFGAPAIVPLLHLAAERWIPSSGASRTIT